MYPTPLQRYPYDLRAFALIFKILLIRKKKYHFSLHEIYNGDFQFKFSEMIVKIKKNEIAPED